MFASSTAKTGYCAFAAAAYTPVHNMVNLDTASVAVSVPLSVIICQLHT